MSDDNKELDSATENLADGQEIMSNEEHPEVPQASASDSKPITITINRAWAKVAAFILAGFLGFVAGAFVTHHNSQDGPRGGNYPGGHSRMHQDDDQFGPGGMMPGNGMDLPDGPDDEPDDEPDDDGDLEDCPDDMPATPTCQDQDDSPVDPQDSSESPTPTN